MYNNFITNVFFSNEPISVVVGNSLQRKAEVNLEVPWWADIKELMIIAHVVDLQITRSREKVKRKWLRKTRAGHWNTLVLSSWLYSSEERRFKIKWIPLLLVVLCLCPCLHVSICEFENLISSRSSGGLVSLCRSIDGPLLLLLLLLHTNTLC